MDMRSVMETQLIGFLLDYRQAAAPALKEGTFASFPGRGHKLWSWEQSLGLEMELIIFLNLGKDCRADLPTVEVYEKLKNPENRKCSLETHIMFWIPNIHIEEDGLDKTGEH